jgi:GntR family transcriptional regulator
LLSNGQQQHFQAVRESKLNNTETLQVNKNIKLPLYMQVHASLHHWITQGRYEPGRHLETESNLCRMFGVSRITIRKSIELLAQEGLVESIQGKGTFVADSNPHLPVRADMNQRISRAKQLARKSSTDDLRIEIESASKEVATDLNLENGEQIITSSYVRVLNEQRIGYAESAFPVSLGIKLTAKDFRLNTMLTILEDKGIALSGIDHLIGATLADARLAGLLDIQVGAPLVRIKMVMLDLLHKPVERVVAFFRADQYEHHMFMTRDTKGSLNRQ